MQSSWATPKLCCPLRGSIPAHSSLLPCSLADCPQIQCVHPYVAQQPDELSLELADVLNILDKTDDGMGDGMGMGWESLWKASLQAGSCKSLPPARERLWYQCHSQRRKLLPSPNSQSKLPKLWQHWHSCPSSSCGPW